MQPTTLNPETHCLDCGEVLSEYGHCWQHHWPPMDPAQDATTSAPALAHPVQQQQPPCQQ
ncbi:hypothetical protein [Hymenobacter sp. BT559]|jgi:hypothetical protein|uniref:hypothetical protein n=1 Tax=Hymenobacter sp. BT559 TaxID=2795729 RepID=UPI0018EB9232|nr:hypothetical protein [Hymenobacter sp. BT559]MBJ6145722.1 hypothetical protein [Hymenobacter sp. BT559]